MEKVTREHLAGYMPIPTAEQLAEALENVGSFHDMSAELIAPELLANLMAATAKDCLVVGEILPVGVPDERMAEIAAAAYDRAANAGATHEQAWHEALSVALAAAPTVKADAKPTEWQPVEKMEAGCTYTYTAIGGGSAYAGGSGPVQGFSSSALRNLDTQTVKAEPSTINCDGPPELDRRHGCWWRKSGHSSPMDGSAVCGERRLAPSLPAAGSELTASQCACGDEYPANSYGAGFMAANNGICENSDAANSCAIEPLPADGSADLIAEAERCLFVMREIGSMDADDITCDSVDLRFEDGEGRDTGCDVSIVDYAEKSADVIEKMIAALSAQQSAPERTKASHAEGGKV